MLFFFKNREPAYRLSLPYLCIKSLDYLQIVLHNRKFYFCQEKLQEWDEFVHFLLSHSYFLGSCNAYFVIENEQVRMRGPELCSQLSVKGLANKWLMGSYPI